MPVLAVFVFLAFHLLCGVLAVRIVRAIDRAFGTDVVDMSGDDSGAIFVLIWPAYCFLMLIAIFVLAAGKLAAGEKLGGRDR